jgi:hypothetical protein
VTGPSHPEIAELLGAYALDAVEADERRLIEDHLRECPRCRDEVAQHRDVAAHLAFAGEPAPDGLWARIAAGIEAGPGPSDLARLYPLRSRSRTRSWAAGASIGLAAVILALVAALGWQVHRQDDRLSGLSAAQRYAGLDGAAMGALVDPRATKVSLTSADRRLRIEAAIEPDGAGFLVPSPGASLPPLPSSETYQLWAVTGSRAVSVGLLGSRPAVATFELSGPRMDTLAITAEKAGGAAQPTRSATVTGNLGPPV